MNSFRSFLQQLFRFWYIFSLAVLLVSISYSKLFLSIGQMMILGGWLVERMDPEKFVLRLSAMSLPERILKALPLFMEHLFRGLAKGLREFSRQKAAMIFFSILLMHVAGLLITTNFDYAFKDLRTKLPFFILPLVISTSPSVGRKTFYRLMLLFAAGVLVRSFFNAWLIDSHRYIDIRDVSRNVSHIIFSLVLCLSFFTLIWFSVKKQVFTLQQRLFILLPVPWILAYIVISQSFTALSVIAITLLILFPFIVFHVRKPLVRVLILLSIAGVTIIAVMAVRSVVKDYYRGDPTDLTRLDSLTARGNPYTHNPYNLQTENGHYLWIYVQWDEMREEWNRRSRLHFDSLDLKNHTVAHTLVRFLSSKGWRKDGDAVRRLSQQEVTAIEKGMANHVLLHEFSLRGRIYEFLEGYERYRETGDPTGSTLMQRLEFWKASAGIIRDHWLTGVGTGDMNEAFASQYQKMGSRLSPDQWWRSHNQFLSVWIGFGIFGLCWFLFAIFYPVFIERKTNDYFVIIILLISMLSMVAEDTIESQTGVTFFVLFYTLFMFARRETDEFLQSFSKPS